MSSHSGRNVKPFGYCTVGVHEVDQAAGGARGHAEARFTIDDGNNLAGFPLVVGDLCKEASMYLPVTSAWLSDRVGRICKWRLLQSEEQ